MESTMSRPKRNLFIESSHTTNGRRQSVMIYMVSLGFPPVYFVELRNQETRIYGSPYEELVYWFVRHSKRTAKLMYYLYTQLQVPTRVFRGILKSRETYVCPALEATCVLIHCAEQTKH